MKFMYVYVCLCVKPSRKALMIHAIVSTWSGSEMYLKLAVSEIKSQNVLHLTILASKNRAEAKTSRKLVAENIVCL